MASEIERAHRPIAVDVSKFSLIEMEFPHFGGEFRACVSSL